MIKEILYRYIDPQFIRFVLVAILNTAFGWCVYAGLLWLINLTHIPNPYILASLLGYVIGILFNFATYSKLVFDNKSKRLLFKFIMVYVLDLQQHRYRAFGEVGYQQLFGWRHHGHPGRLPGVCAQQHLCLQEESQVPESQQEEEV